MKINTIVTRFPNLECGLFAALAEIDRFCEHLGITRGLLKWIFVSTYQGNRGDIPKGDSIISFNTGGGKWDQHGHSDNETLCQKCSLDLVRGDYDFLNRRPWLRQVYALIAENDRSGAAIVNHKHGLRELMNGLTVSRASEPELVLDWLSLAFWGVFTRCQAGEDVANVFTPEQLIAGVAEYAPDRLEWFRGLLNEAVETIEREWTIAKTAVSKAIKDEFTAEVDVPAVGGNVRVVTVFCDSVKTAAAARQRGYQFCIQRTSAGNCQIHGGLVFVGTGGELVAKLKLDLSEVAASLRLWEARFRGVRIAQGEDWKKPGFVKDDSGTDVPWYFPDFRTSIYNGTLSSADMPPTKVQPNKMMEIVCNALPKCQLAANSPALPEGATTDYKSKKTANPPASSATICEVVDVNAVAAAFAKKARGKQPLAALAKIEAADRATEVLQEVDDSFGDVVHP